MHIRIYVKQYKVILFVLEVLYVLKFRWYSLYPVPKV